MTVFMSCLKGSLICFVGFVQVNSAHMLSFIGWIHRWRCWSGSCNRTSNWFELSMQRDEVLLKKGRQHWVLLSPGQGQSNLSRTGCEVEVKIFGKGRAAFLTDTRYAGEAVSTLENCQLCLCLTSSSRCLN